MKTKILAGVMLATIITAGTLTYADSQTGTGVAAQIKAHTVGQMKPEGGFGFKGGGMGGRMTELTDAEKTKVAAMTDTEKKAYFETKMTEQKALHDAKEAVIDKLINGEALNDTEKATLVTIKTERATEKTERAAREAKMTEMKTIMEKVKAGTTLTADEQAKVDAMKTEHTGKDNGQRGGRGR